MKNRERAPRRSREQWRDLVGKWRASGTSAREFAVAHDLTLESLQHWYRVFGREASVRNTPKLLPVRVTPAPEAAERSLELAVGPMRVRFEGGASPTYVAAVAHALLRVGTP